MNSENVDIFLDKTKPTYVGGILEMATTTCIKFGEVLRIP
jgi:hypothetical protein